MKEDGVDENEEQVAVPFEEKLRRIKEAQNQEKVEDSAVY